MRPKQRWYDSAGERLLANGILLGMIVGLALAGGWIVLKFISGFNGMLARGFGQ